MTCISIRFLTLPQALAFTFSPMSINFEPHGKGSTQSFMIENSGPEKQAIQISMALRQIDIDGIEKNPEADNDFSIYPTQFILGSNDKRTIRVTWLGNTEPKEELAYRIIAEQLPIDTQKQDKSKNVVIHMLLKYMGAVYITPKNTKPNIVIENTRLVRKKNKSMLEITFKNQGTSHQVLKNINLDVESSTKKGMKAKLDPEDLKPLLGQNILANSQRRFFLPWPPQIPEGPVKVSLELKD